LQALAQRRIDLFERGTGDRFIDPLLLREAAVEVEVGTR
jgi:hypothetical protein